MKILNLISHVIEKWLILPSLVNKKITKGVRCDLDKKLKKVELAFSKLKILEQVPFLTIKYFYTRS